MVRGDGEKKRQEKKREDKRAGAGKRAPEQSEIKTERGRKIVQEQEKTGAQ